MIGLKLLILQPSRLSNLSDSKAAILVPEAPIEFSTRADFFVGGHITTT